MKTSTYLLYNNENQDKLLAMTSNEKEIPEISKHYRNGYWLEYDEIEGKPSKYGKTAPELINERPYKKKVEFDGSIIKKISDFEEVSWFKGNGIDIRQEATV